MFHFSTTVHVHVFFRCFSAYSDDDDDIVDKTLLRIDSISARIEKVEVLIDEGGKNVARHAKRLRILEKTLDTAYSALEANDNNDDD